MSRPLLLSSLVLASLCEGQMVRIPGPGGKASAGASPTTVTFNSVSGGAAFGGGGSAIASSAFTTNPSAGNAVVVLAFILGSPDIVSVCDGTGTGQCTGGSTYTSMSAYANGSLNTQVWYTCNYQGAGGSGNTVTVNQSGSTGIYGVAIVATGNTATGTACIDGEAKTQNTGSGTAVTSGSVTTSNAHDLLIGFVAAIGGGSLTAGVDGQGNSMTYLDGQAGVVWSTYRNTSTTAAYAPTSTLGTTSSWNAETVAIK